MAKAVSNMNKGELVKEAMQRGVDVPGGNKKEHYEAVNVEELRGLVRDARDGDETQTPAQQRGATPRDPNPGGNAPAQTSSQDPQSGSTEVAAGMEGTVPVPGGAQGKPDPGGSAGIDARSTGQTAPGQTLPTPEDAITQMGAGLPNNRGLPDPAVDENHADELATATQPVVQEQRALIRQRAATEADPEVMGDVMSVANVLRDLPREALVRLQTALNNELSTKGQEPPQPPVSEIAMVNLLPVNMAASAELDPRAALAAVANDPNAPGGLDLGDMMSCYVRQATNPAGGPVGPAYAVVGLIDGSKLAGQL